MIISLNELVELSKNLPEDEIILDVRTPHEHSEIRLNNSINIDHEDVDEHIERLKNFSRIHIHCKRGGRAKKAFDALEDEGFTNLTVCTEGGIDHLIDLGVELIRD